MKIDVLFFGKLMDETGVRRCEAGNVTTVAELEEQLYQRYPTLQKQHYLITVNQVIASSEQLLNNGDEVALLPPYAGG